MNRKKVCIVFVLCFFGMIFPAEAKKVKVAAAANLRYVLESIKETYEAEHKGVQIEITFGSSGTLTQQIAHGAPFDFFMAADVDFPVKVKEMGFASGEVKTYAYGQLAMWSLSVDVAGGIQSVTSPSVKKIAIADPKKAPYGENTVEVLKKQGLYDTIEKKIVWGENISQTAQYAFSGNAEIGFIALSLALAPDMKGKGFLYLFPPDICPPVQQACVLLKQGAANRDARDFMDYVLSPACHKEWIAFGYALAKDE
ncbi:molybdate ABC transporter substrate-binding protein [Proteiniphilum sp.]|uniref:molybdate ABC transporter substrate-binding protein n=1 Tax=Proteiniphilum sp. TaxID=1926877 RepID=UPI002B21A417|nr:molybdate ABC transporter substrate-binding protein [Proteiniphilum sp.]MEA4917538.1 molybdate ABC transporter substrate-binding protein [Proteiniphilum sp.]